MERKINWRVSASDSAFSTLGYRIRFSLDRHMAKNVMQDNTLSTIGVFEYLDGDIWTPFPSAGLPFPTQNTPVRYQTPTSLYWFIVVENGRVSVSDAWGRDFIYRVYAPIAPIFCYADQQSGQVWILDSNKIVHVFCPLQAKIVKSFPVASEAIAIIPDGFRQRYWLVAPTECRLYTMRGKELLVYDQWTPSTETITGIRQAEACPFSGELRLAFTSGDSNLFLSTVVNNGNFLKTNKAYANGRSCTGFAIGGPKKIYLASNELNNATEIKIVTCDIQSNQATLTNSTMADIQAVSMQKKPLRHIVIDGNINGVTTIRKFDGTNEIWSRPVLFPMEDAISCRVIEHQSKNIIYYWSQQGMGSCVDLGDTVVHSGSQTLTGSFLSTLAPIKQSILWAEPKAIDPVNWGIPAIE